MPVDTRDKRFSLIGLCQPSVPWVMPNPDGTINDADFEQWLYGYAGVQFSGPGDPRTRRWGGLPHVRIGGSFAGRTW